MQVQHFMSLFCCNAVGLILGVMMKLAWFMYTRAQILDLLMLENYHEYLRARLRRG
jgi:hypothetical protein